MAETTQRHIFTFQEVAELLVKKRNLHTGLWSVSLEFGIGAINVKQHEDSKDFFPTALVPVRNIGLVPGVEDNSLTVDAAKVNPKGKSGRVTTTKTKRNRKGTRPTKRNRSHEAPY